MFRKTMFWQTDFFHPNLPLHSYLCLIFPSFLMKGFLFDCQQSGNKIILWVKTRFNLIRLEDDYSTYFYAKDKDMAKLEEHLKGRGLDIVLEELPDLYNESVLVFRIKESAQNFTKTVRWLEKLYKYDIDLYNADMPINQRYLYDKDLLPMHEVEFEYKVEMGLNGEKINKLTYIKSIDKEEFDYPVPELKTISVEFKLSDHKFEPQTRVIGAYVNGEQIKGWEKAILFEFMRQYVKEDADVVIFHNEEEFLIPFLYERFRKYNLQFDFGREPQVFQLKQGKSYFSYGYIVRRAPAYYFFGRWHLNANWFMYEEGNLNGLIEFSRTTGVLPQKAARTSPGSGVSNLQVLEAYRQGFLIPYKKNQIEEFKTGNALIASDRGGMILEPKVGLHTEIAEIDFFSLYPSIMVEHNLSPETMMCKCCLENTVPQIDYNVCEKRDGILRVILKPILKRRLYYKKMKKIPGEKQKMYEERATVLKWLLVTCFGYTGYRNAKFGRIECHQSICAFARHKLIQAMRVAEKHGFEVIHGIIDSLWIKKEGITKEQVQAVCKEIESVTKVPIQIENIYRWFVFLPSLMNANVPVPTRFYGANLNAELKVRGIEFRRKDTCALVKRFQEECLNLLAEAQNTEQFHERIPQLFFILDKYLKKLYDGDFVLKDLVIKRQLSKALHRYKGNNVQHEIAQMLTKQKITIAPGMSASYVYVENGKSKQYQKAIPLQLLQTDFKYSPKEYEKLLVKALESMLLPFGFDEGAILKRLDREKQRAILEYSEIPIE